MKLSYDASLPRLDGLDIGAVLAAPGGWARRVSFDTERHLQRAHDPWPADPYRYSGAYLCAEFLLHVLQ